MAETNVGFSRDAYNACQRGDATKQQQQSAASQIILLHAEIGRLKQRSAAMLEIIGAAMSNERIDEIDKIAAYKYFGDYEMSEAQLDAALDAIYALTTIKRLREL